MDGCIFLNKCPTKMCLAKNKKQKTKNKKKKKKKTAHVSVEDNVEREDLLHKTYLVLGVFFWIKISCERCRFL